MNTTKTLAALSVVALLAAAPGLVASAEARRDQRPRGWCDRGRQQPAPYYEDAAWDVVRSDPCRSEEYARYARRHQNPNKRRRYLERLAREGCSRYDQAGAYDDRYDRGDERYRDPYGRDYDRYPTYPMGRDYDPYPYGRYDGSYYSADRRDDLGTAIDAIYPLMGLFLGR